MAAVQNLKSRWAAVATPMTPVSAASPLQAAVKPTSHSTPISHGQTLFPSTPTSAAVRAEKSSGSMTPQKVSSQQTPKSAGSLKTLSGFNTPRTPNSNLSLVSC